MHSTGVMYGQHTCSNRSKIKRGIYMATYVFPVSISEDWSADNNNCFRAFKHAAAVAAQAIIAGDSMLHKIIASVAKFRDCR